MSKLDVVLVGLGNVGFQYDREQPQMTLSHYNALMKHPNFNLVGCVDEVVPEGWQYEVPLFENLDDDIPNADVYVVSVPTKLHLELVAKILARFTPRIIFLEKPGGVNISETKKIIEIASNCGVPVLVNYFRDVSVENIQKDLEVIGKIQKIGIEYTGTLENIGFHFLSFVRAILCGRIRVLNKYPGQLINVYQLECAEVPIVVIENAVSLPLINEIKFIGENGKVLYNNEANSLETYNLVSSSIFPNEKHFDKVSERSLGIEKSMFSVYDAVFKFCTLGYCNLPNIENVLDMKEEVLK